MSNPDSIDSVENKEHIINVNEIQQTFPIPDNIYYACGQQGYPTELQIKYPLPTVQIQEIYKERSLCCFPVPCTALQAGYWTWFDVLNILQRNVSTPIHLLKVFCCVVWLPAICIFSSGMICVGVIGDAPQFVNHCCGCHKCIPCCSYRYEAGNKKNWSFIYSDWHGGCCSCCCCCTLKS